MKICQTFFLSDLTMKPEVVEPAVEPAVEPPRVESEHIGCDYLIDTRKGIASHSTMCSNQKKKPRSLNSSLNANWEAVECVILARSGSI